MSAYPSATRRSISCDNKNDYLPQQTSATHRNALVSQRVTTATAIPPSHPLAQIAFTMSPYVQTSLEESTPTPTHKMPKGEVVNSTVTGNCPSGHPDNLYVISNSFQNSQENTEEAVNFL